MSTFALALHFDALPRDGDALRSRLTQALADETVVGPCNAAGDCEVLIVSDDEAQARRALEHAIVSIDAVQCIALVERGEGVAPRHPQ